MRTAFVSILLALLASTTLAQNPPRAGLFVDTQFLWFDSEFDPNFEFAPRIIAGYDDVFGARVRYWTYDNASRSGVPQTINGTGVDRTIRLDFDVIDVEATTHIRREWSDFLLSGGARLAHIDHNRVETNSVYIGPTLHSETFSSYEKTGLGGVTLAAEGRTSLLPIASILYGGRLSMLQGDWQGDLSTTWWGTDPVYNLQNETFIVPEVFTGVEMRLGRAFTRLSIEFQDWQGRVRSGPDGSTGGHDFGFTGYGIDLGYSF